MGMVVLGAGLSRAQPSQAEKAAAEALYDEALKLMDAGRHAEACPKLAESNRLDAAVGTLLHLGDCYAATGKTASAWSACAR